MDGTCPLRLRGQIENAAEGVLVEFFHPTLRLAILRKPRFTAVRKHVIQLAPKRGAAHLQRNEKKNERSRNRSAVSRSPVRCGNPTPGASLLRQGSTRRSPKLSQNLCRPLAAGSKSNWARFYSPGFIWIWENSGEGQRIELRPTYPPESSSSSFAVGGAEGGPGHNPPHPAAKPQIRNAEACRRSRIKRALEADPSFFVGLITSESLIWTLRREGRRHSRIGTAAQSDSAIPDITYISGLSICRKGIQDGRHRIYKRRALLLPAGMRGTCARTGLRFKKDARLALQELGWRFLTEDAQFLNTVTINVQADTFFERGHGFSGKTGNKCGHRSVLKALRNWIPAEEMLIASWPEAFFRQGDYRIALKHALEAANSKTPVRGLPLSNRLSAAPRPGRPTTLILQKYLFALASFERNSLRSPFSRSVSAFFTARPDDFRVFADSFIYQDQIQAKVTPASNSCGHFRFISFVFCVRL